MAGLAIPTPILQDAQENLLAQVRDAVRPREARKEPGHRLLPAGDKIGEGRRVAGLPPPHPFCVLTAHANELNARGAEIDDGKMVPAEEMPRRSLFSVHFEMKLVKEPMKDWAQGDRRDRD